MDPEFDGLGIIGRLRRRMMETKKMRKHSDVRGLKK
jgi:hypothetical protein